MDYRVRKVNGRWVAWDPYWRPIDAIEWTGTEWTLKDETYSKDPTDYTYTVSYTHLTLPTIYSV